MIVTRRRRKSRKWGWVVAVIAVLVAAGALSFWPPVREGFSVARDASAARQEIAQRDRTIADLRARIASQQKQIARMGDSTGDATSVAAAANAPAAVVAQPTIAPPTAVPSPGDLTANATPDMRRTAQMWAAMDPGDAAKIVARMRPAYTARIFALMPADAAGQILDALPAAYGARVTQENPQLRP